jgi:hypothetical protein
MKRTEMRFRTRAKFIKTREGDALTFGFRLGPISIFCIVNMPESGGSQEGPLVFVKMDLRVNEDWTEWTNSTEYPKDHSHKDGNW